MTGFISNAFIGLKEAGSLLKGFNQLKTEAEVAQKPSNLIKSLLVFKLIYLKPNLLIRRQLAV